jgi:hypothetical protein
MSRRQIRQRDSQVRSKSGLDGVAESSLTGLCWLRSSYESAVQCVVR